LPCPHQRPKRIAYSSSPELLLLHRGVRHLYPPIFAARALGLATRRYGVRTFDIFARAFCAATVYSTLASTVITPWVVYVILQLRFLMDSCYYRDVGVGASGLTLLHCRPRALHIERILSLAGAPPTAVRIAQCDVRVWTPGLTTRIVFSSL